MEAVYRDLSLSLAAHVALIGALLALSATHPAVRAPEVVRPVRLVAYLEPPAAAPGRPAPARASEPARRVEPPPPPRAAERAAHPAPARTAAAPVKPVIPVAIPKIAFPSSAPPQADRPRTAPRPPAPKTEPTLSDRLARRLAAPAPAATETAAPRVASLPRPEETVPPRPASVAAPAVAGVAVPPTGPVEAAGYFPHTWYLNALMARVDESWTPPSEFWVGAGSVAALVSFRIGRDGRISRVSLKESSGHARFDRSALAAIQRLAQVPALPEQYAEESLDVVIRMRNDE